MAVFKCKMCGGEMSFEEGSTVAVCDYCGSRQTLPRLDNDRKVNLFDRANHFRRNNDFDKAMAIYEQILNEDIKDAEAYWSLVLCQYGIQYVEDPSTHKRIPTVNRTQFTSIYADENYKAAIANADAAQRAIYEEEAKKIEEIQKGILAISEKEEPFDVFICYKESDENGRRTRDSVLANDLYYQLTQEGFKVFFSRITLEDKLGSAYEPYIFAALHSAKVMIVIGTKPEYFNAVWVKNEWSRYLSLIKQGEKKTLIPAYRDIDPYDLPEEFSHLQAQDMSKLGFMQDLLRGIRKLAGKEDPKNVSAQGNANAPSGVNTQSLLKRAFLFLEDKQWDSADAYCDKVLDMDPENAQAYYGKLLAELHVPKPEALRNAAQPFDGMNNYKKVIRFADEKLKNQLQETVAFVKNRNIYNSGQSKMRTARMKREWEVAAAEFQKIPGFRDADALVKKCIENAATAQKDADYNWALQQYATATKSQKSAYDRKQACSAAIEKMKTVSGWKDADTLLVQYQKTLSELKELAQEEAATTERVRAEKAQQNLLKIKRERRNAVLRRIGIVVVALLIVCGIGVLIGYVVKVVVPDHKYDEAVELLEDKNYAEAIPLLFEIPDHEEGKQELKNLYDRADSLLNEKKYFEAYWIFKEFGDYNEAKEKAQIARKGMVSKASIAAGNGYTVAVKKDGTVVATGDNSFGQCDVSSWTGIVAVAAGNNQTFGIKSDGTVVAAGSNFFKEFEEMAEWTDIVAISPGEDRTYGLKSDGTVVATRKSKIEWTNIQAIAAGSILQETGLKIDGTVVRGSEDNSKAKDSWNDIVAIDATNNHTVGLKSDGTVIGVGSNRNGMDFYDESMDNWTGITAIATGDDFVAGINSAGKVVVSANAALCDISNADVSQWNNIVQICAGYYHLVGLRADGTVVAVGSSDYFMESNSCGECDVSGWRDILVPTP